jgi:choline transport protein
VNAPKASAAEVFAGFENTGGWSNMGLAVLAGQLSAIYTMCGTDSVSNTLSQKPELVLTHNSF